MASTRRSDLFIDRDRLWRSIMELAQIGAYLEDGTGLSGVSRPTLTVADVDARRTLISWMEEAGLSVRIDRIGNIYGRREGRDPSAAPVMTGSHIDTVDTAGAFDGPLGVLGALEVVRTLNDVGVETCRPIDVACFTEEEGSRFGTDMLGSAVAAGRISLHDALALRAADGTSLGQALTDTGFAGATPELLAPPHAYVECHIEQGPIMGRSQLDVGVVTGTQGISWQEITVGGRAAHAGATPMELRADAGLAAAAVVLHLRELSESSDFDGLLRTTVGKLALSPNVVNIVSARAVFTVDLRCPDDSLLQRAEDQLDQFLEGLTRSYPGLDLSKRRLARTGQVPFDAGVQQLIADLADERGLTHARLLSGAGHDAQELAAICPAGMIFVRGEYDGISHTPREYSSPESCEVGINVLASTVVHLANQQ